MNEEFHRRQLEAEQHEQAAQNKTHATMETYNIEQHEANAGHFTPGASDERQVPEAAPSLWQRIKKMLGMS